MKILCRGRALRLGSLVSLTILALLLPTTAGTAFAQPDSSSELLSAMRNVSSGKYSDADMELLKRHPEAARIVPDPNPENDKRGVTLSAGAEKSVLGKLLAPGQPTTPPEFSASGCWWAEVWFSKKSTLGNTLYKWHHRIEWCGNDTSAVTSWGNRLDYITEVDPVIYQRDLKTDWTTGTGTYTAESFRQRHLEYCALRVGCYANTYPWSQITAWYDGYYGYEGSAG